MDYKEKVIALLNSQELSKEQKEKLESIFPELKESEDERIGKSLSAYFAKFKPNDMWDADFSFGDIVAWLEKQGEKKPVNNVEPKFKVGDKIQYLKGCGTIMTIEKIENDEYIFANNLGHTTIEDGNKWYLVECNPTWSEKDEIGLCDALWCIKQASRIAKDENEIGNCWYAENWLKSLRPQNRWKPNDKQMSALKAACREHYDPKGALYSLCEDLVKLKGE